MLRSSSIDFLINLIFCFLWERVSAGTYGNYVYSMERTNPSFEGVAMNEIGDFNGDGVKDIAVIATNNIVAVLYGSTKWEDYNSQNFNFTSMSIETGFTIFHPDPNIYFASLISPAGDINGDGYSDFILTYFSLKQSTYLIFGRKESSHLNLLTDSHLFSSISLDTPMFKVIGIGDFNGDRIDDIIFCLNVKKSHVDQFESFSIFPGRQIDFPLQLNSDYLLHDKLSMRIINSDKTYYSFIPIGDLNQDGYSDVAFTTVGKEILIVFGSVLFPKELDLSISSELAYRSYKITMDDKSPIRLFSSFFHIPKLRNKLVFMSKFHFKVEFFPQKMTK